MKRIQQWFEKMAGITQDELDRLSLAYAVFGAEELDISHLQTPACWRRAPRVRR